jgi:streptogramin lyase
MTPVGGITFGPDGNIWFPAGDQVGKLNPTTGIIQEFDLPSFTNFQGQIVSGPDGDLWFATFRKIEKVNPATGAVQEYSIPGVFPGMSGGSIAFDQTGILWFAFIGKGNNVVMGGLDPTTGQIEQFVLPDYTQMMGWNPYGQSIVLGSDGGIWYIGSSGVDRFDPISKTVRMFSASQGAFGLGAGPDGNIYFTTSTWSLIGRIDPATGHVEMIGNPAPPGRTPMDNWTPAYSFVFGSDGAVWTIGSGSINEFNTATGNYQQFAVGHVGAAMTLDANGNFWFPYFPASAGYTPRYAIGQIGEFNPTTGAFQTFDLSTGTLPPANGSTGNSSGASGTSFNATAGINFETAVAFLTPQTPVVTPGSAYKAVIDWGDGSNSILVFTVTDNSTYSIVADHTYQTAGTFKVKVTISPFESGDSLGSGPITVFSTANVSANPWDFNQFAM